MQVRHWIAGFVVTVALAFGLSTGASATIVQGDFGDPGPVDLAVPGGYGKNKSVTPAGTIDDAWTFTLLDDANAAITGQVNNSSGFNIVTSGGSQFTVSLYQVVGTIDAIDNSNPDLLLASAPALGSTNILFSYAGLSAGIQYYLLVTGLANGTVGGNYSLLLNVSNVPLPAAIWLFISALLGLVSFARIRRNGTAA